MVRRKGYDPARFAAYLERLLKERNESYREASLQAGLDHGAVRRFVKGSTRPHRDSCIALAQHFGVNPNEMLTAAGYDPIPLFDLSLIDPNELPPEVKAVARDLAEIADPTLRREVCQAVRALVNAHKALSKAPDTGATEPPDSQDSLL